MRHQRDMDETVVLAHIGDYPLDEKMLSGSVPGVKCMHLVDSSQNGAYNSANNENIVFINTNDVSDVEQFLLDLMPFSTLFIHPVLSNRNGTDAEEQAGDLLNRLFFFLKASYMPLIRQRGCKVWIFGIDYMDPDLCQTSSQFGILRQASNAGIKAMSRVTALELAKRKVTVNFLELTEGHFYSAITSILGWTSNESSLYITAQDILIGE